MLKLLLIAALAILPFTGPVRESCDLIELNSFYDEYGRLVFDQTIFYDWSDGETRYNVRAWRLVKNPSQIPEREWGGLGYVARWHDGETLREMRSKWMRRTWLQYDPELVEREHLPKERRKELRHPSLARPQERE